MYYQLFDGENADNLTVTVHTTDMDTGEIYGTAIYPEALEDME